MTQTHVAHLSSHAEELTLPCVRYSECSNEARWAAWSSHGLSCPSTGFVCTPCKSDVERDWTEKLQRGSVQCSQCKGVASGQVSDHLRFMPL